MSEQGAAYAIAAFLPEEARRAAVAAEYAPTQGYALPNARTVDGCCPLAVALRAMGIDAPSSPNGMQVASRLGNEGLFIPAGDFMWDWDSGRVTDLAAALGVPRE